MPRLLSSNPHADARPHATPPANDTGETRLAALRRTVARLETGWLSAPPPPLSLDLPDIHRHLPDAGLPCGALHEVSAAAYGDIAASFGFAAALMACALRVRRGPALLVVSRRGADVGSPYGHGLRRLGLDIGRLLLIETRTGKDALWAMEEILRADAGAAAVAGISETPLDLTMSRRLNLAASAAGTPLMLLRPPAATGLSAATTRWRVALERCRNGRAGQWTVEWDHVAHRFRLAEVVADRAVPAGTSRTGQRRAV